MVDLCIVEKVNSDGAIIYCIAPRMITLCSKRNHKTNTFHVTLPEEWEQGWNVRLVFTPNDHDPISFYVIQDGTYAIPSEITVADGTLKADAVSADGTHVYTTTAKYHLLGSSSGYIDDSEPVTQRELNQLRVVVASKVDQTTWSESEADDLNESDVVTDVEIDNILNEILNSSTDNSKNDSQTDSTGTSDGTITGGSIVTDTELDEMLNEILEE